MTGVLQPFRYDHVLTVGQAAALLHVHRNTVRRYGLAVMWTELTGGNRRFWESDVRALAEQLATPTS